MSHTKANVRTNESGGCAEQGINGTVLSGSSRDHRADHRAAREPPSELTGIGSVAGERELVDHELERAERADAGNDVRPRERPRRLAQLTLARRGDPLRCCRDAEKGACAGRGCEKDGGDGW